MHILIGQPPQRAQERDQQQGLLAVGAWRSPWSGRQGGRTPTMRQAHRQPTEREQMQRADQRERINVQGRSEPRLRSVICWWGHWCLFGNNGRHHKLTSRARELASPSVSLPYFFELGNALDEDSTTYAARNASA